ncbi:MAG: Gfo/Idh/MocA family oxidoreductase [Acidobacteria bacterium]|nr:Gfo/Idh/MocA family oxidoreductase [Acidobacteriota bacterium]
MALRISLVGCGKAAENHGSQIQHIRDVRLVAVCDREPLMAEQLAARYSVPKVYVNYSEMLEKERPDVVHIATPPQSHFDLAITAFEHGCHVFVEKPAACSHFETQRLLTAAAASHRKLTVGWGYYFDPISRDMRRIVDSGAIGEVVHMNSHFGYDLLGPFGWPVLSDSDHWVRGLPGKLIQNVADHIFNKIVEFLPGESPVVDTQVWSNYRGCPQLMPTEMRVLIKDGSPTATAIMSSTVRPLIHQFQIFGTKGSLSLDFTSGILSANQTPTVRGVIGSLLSGYSDAWRRFAYANGNAARLVKGEFGYFSGLQFLMSAFYRSIRQDCAPPISYDLILRVSDLVDRVLSHPRLAVCERQRIV